MNQYRKLKDRQQEEVNNFPLGFAFSEKQFDEMMTNRGFDPKKDLWKISRLPIGGGFIRKSDIPAFRSMMERHRAETQEAIDKDPDGKGFIYDMFRYELDNHEYGYTGDAEEALSCLGYTLEEIENDKRLKAGFKKACKAIMAN